MDTVETLLQHAGAPGLIHLHHPHHPPSALEFHLPARCKVARLDAVEHHTARLLYAGILSRVATVLRRDLDEKDDGREVITWDAFTRSLRALWGQYAGKGKGKARAGEEEGQVVIIVTKAERLKGVLGSSWAALTRLPELVSRRVRDCS
jgi:origin recognition complex subunit 5